MLNFKEIFKSWITFSNPTEQQEHLAKARLDICEGCEYKKEVVKKKSWSLLCGKCGCPLKGKVYTPNTYLDENGSCPLGKWKEIEIEYLKTFKKTKTIL